MRFAIDLLPWPVKVKLGSSTLTSEVKKDYMEVFCVQIKKPEGAMVTAFFIAILCSVGLAWYGICYQDWVTTTGLLLMPWVVLASYGMAISPDLKRARRERSDELAQNHSSQHLRRHVPASEL